MTNYEVVKAIGINELAGFLASITTCCGCPAYGNCGGPAYVNRDGHEVCTAYEALSIGDEPVTIAAMA